MSRLPEVITALLDPAQYPNENPSRVELLQTQMSFVLLTDRYAYKIRKPVNLGYVDYSSLEKRRHFSRKELDLNRRLCPDGYLDMVAVTRDHGKIVLGGDGEIIDYAVRMKRLPQDGMMDRLLAEDGLTSDMITAVARKMAEFHQGAATGGDIDEFGSLETIRGNVAENFEQSRPYIGRALSQAHFDALKAYFDRFLETGAPLFARRVAEGRIRDCHGDLHSAHVNFNGDEICIYDCIEFNDRFRYGDTASEIAFLAMDLDRHGRSDLKQAFVAEYARHANDRGLYRLLKFYQAYRAHIRAKVACFKLDDPFVPEEEKTAELSKARGYFDLALAYTLSSPLLFITSGPTGCGKSTLAGTLTRHLGLRHISSDITRKKLAGIEPGTPASAAYTEGLYSPEMTQRTYVAMLDSAEKVLAGGGSVILDATFLKKTDRDRALGLAKRYSARPVIIECRLDEAEARQRLERRATEPGNVSDGCWAVYQRQRDSAEPVEELPEGRNHVIIDTRHDPEEAIRDIIAILIETPGK
ncbi:aminoglycoside phosphotransferase [Dehalogenimonas lykanthroporepellens BL-DC-9]|jgi:aminoglycoside phosphotransferase family enzyme/predicted kinase|nr:aminoglycoside phosphotransferase [Dehalogenimonas lykanthroporepellens BL-DC-9]